MGDGKWKSQYRRRNDDAKASTITDGLQTKLTYTKKYSHIDQSDVNTFLIPVLKEVGKAICPPAAIPIEILYQLYKHSDAMVDIGHAVAKGDYKEAAKLVVKEGVKELGGMVITSIIEPHVKEISACISKEASNSVKDEKEKQVVEKVVGGTVDGIAEGATDKVVDTLVDKVADKVADNHE
jgi:hypothetical protein